MTEHLHAPFPPSGAHRWFECPGSVRESAGLPDVETPAAAEGTFLHQVATLCLRHHRPARQMLGWSDMVHTLTEAQADAVQEALDYVRALGFSHMWVDLRVRANDDVWGTLDVAGVSYDATGAARLHVIDFKFGSGVFVPVVANKQLLCYGFGFLLGPEFAEVNFDVEEVVFHIVQPRHHRKDELEPWAMSVAELSAWGKGQLVTAVGAGKAPNAPLVPGDHCQFCKARPHCRALRDQAKAQVLQLFEDETLARPAAKPPEPASLTLDEVAVALRAFPIVEEWMKAVREHAYNLAAGGKAPPGFKLVAKESNRKWAQDEATTALVLEAHLPAGKTPWAPSKLVTPAEAERRMPSALHGIIDKLAKREVTGSVLVPESDRRPRLERGAVFDDGTSFLD